MIKKILRLKKYQSDILILILGYSIISFPSCNTDSKSKKITCDHIEVLNLVKQIYFDNLSENEESDKSNIDIQDIFDDQVSDTKCSCEAVLIDQSLRKVYDIEYIAQLNSDKTKVKVELKKEESYKKSKKYFPHN